MVRAFHGAIQPIPGGSTSWVFAGPTTDNVTTTATQRLTGTATGVMGLSPGAAAQQAGVNLCYQPAAGGIITDLSANQYVIHRFAGEHSTYSTSSSRGPGAGTWKVGMCVRNTGTAAIDNNDWVNGWVMVT